MSGTDEPELNRIREAYGDLMNEEDRVHFPTAQEQAKKRIEQREKREKEISRIEGLISTLGNPWRWSMSFGAYNGTPLFCIIVLGTSQNTPSRFNPSGFCCESRENGWYLPHSFPFLSL